MIKVQKLSKRLGQRQVFRQLDFVWQAPGIICVCGPNGAGKTTLLSMLAGAMRPDSGVIRIRDDSLVDAHTRAVAHVAYVPDACPVYPFISGREWLNFVKSLRNTDSALEDELLAAFGLYEHVGIPFGAMSLGTAKKFMLMSALICTTPVIILDEPTNGLDQQSVEVLKQHLRQRATSGLVVLTCHDQVQRQNLGATLVELSKLEGV